MFQILLQIFKQPISKSKLSNRRSLHTVCPRSSDPFYNVTYYINGALLPGHTAVKLYYIYMKKIYLTRTN